MLREQYNAARNQAALVRQNWMGILKLTGPERQAWLQGMVTNEVEKLTPGEGCYAGHLTAQGKLVAQMIVLVAEEELLLLVEREAAAKLVGVFDKLIIMEDVQVRDASDEYEVLGLTGRNAGKALEVWAGTPFPASPLYRHRLLPQGRVVSTDLGYDLIVPSDRSGEVVEKIAAAGAIPIDADAWNILRVEAGLPLYGIDIDDTTTLPELGPRGISYDKGCYIGQEVVARIKYIGHVNRRFVGFVCEGSVVPDVRSTVQMNGKDAGYVTTAIFSPGLAKPIALGFVNRVAAEPGTAVVLGGRENVTAAVASLPFLPIRSED
jgi:folate-binding protein YgfZ